jgi:hypothetical protein
VNACFGVIGPPSMADEKVATRACAGTGPQTDFSYFRNASPPRALNAAVKIHRTSARPAGSSVGGRICIPWLHLGFCR